MAKKAETPEEVTAIRGEIKRCMDAVDSQGRAVGNAKFGVYAFYDYDGEPIYVGQTYEKLRSRIGRHLNNQRTDAVAMNVLDPFEVAEIEMWPLFSLEDLPGRDPRIQEALNAAEYAVYAKLVDESRFGAVLNEKVPPPSNPVELPESLRRRIIPDDVYSRRRHPDVRIARRAMTIANLARVISEREVSAGLRHTLLVQAERLEHLARERLSDFPGVETERSKEV